MLIELTLAATASLLLSAQTSAQATKQPPTAPPQKRFADDVAPLQGASLERGTWAMALHIPTILVLIACKVIVHPNTDPNAAYTHVENLEWATENSMMVCRRHEIPLYDPVEGMQRSPADAPMPGLNPNFAVWSQCQRAGLRLEMDWDTEHRNTPWRVWRIGCPSPIMDLQTGQIIGYKLPECGHRDTVVCEVDSVI
jgi:hypothetical protein